MSTKPKESSAPPPRPVPMSLLVTSQYNEDLFWKGLKRSAATHAAVVIVGVIASISLTREPVKFVPSIRVDLVSLPDLKKADLSKIQPNENEDLNSKLDKATKGAKKVLEQVQKEPEPMLKPVLPREKTERAEKAEKPKKKDLQNAIDRIKAVAALEGEDKKSEPRK